LTTHTICVINPGSTSTKLAVFRNDEPVCSETIRHSAEQLSSFASLWEQLPFRLGLVKGWLTRSAVAEISAAVGIGGLFRPVAGGTYRVTERMLADARANLQGEHASNLGCALAFEVARAWRVPSFVVDPVSVDEFEPLARYSGHPAIQRKSLSHALNIHAAARNAALDLNADLSRSSFIIAHLGGGISIAPVVNGRIVDVNDAASDGPFSPERTGGLPLQSFISVVLSGRFTEAEMRSFVMGRGGLVAYLGTNSIPEVEKRIAAGDALTREVFQAMAYQIAKEIGAMSAVLSGKIDAVVLTGGMAHSSMLVGWITERIRFLGKVLVFPGEDEMRAMAMGVLRVLNKTEEGKEY
jgi:butyrate kinase